MLPRHPAIYLVGLMALLAMIPEGAVLDWAALYLQQELGADIATAGFAFAGFSGSHGADALLRRRRAQPFRRGDHPARLEPRRGGRDAGGRPRAVTLGGHRGLRALPGWASPTWCRSPFRRPATSPAWRRDGHERGDDDGLFGHPGRALGDRLHRRDASASRRSSSRSRCCWSWSA